MRRAFFGSSIVLGSLTASWKCSGAACVRNREELEALLTSVSKVSVLDAWFAEPFCDADTDSSVYQCCIHQQEWLTKVADALALLLPGPHTHAVGCFHVFSARCCL